MFYADRVGLKTIYDRVATFHRELGQRWAPAPLLERLAKEPFCLPQFVTLITYQVEQTA